MSVPTQITFLHVDSSPAVETRIQDEIRTLERHFSRIQNCRVVVEAPHHHHQRGAGFAVRVDLRVPGSEIVVNQSPSLRSTLSKSESPEWQKHLETHPEHKDVYICIRDAFSAARRQLEDYARMLRGHTKPHAGTHTPEATEAG